MGFFHRQPINLANLCIFFERPAFTHEYE
jgi:hypothetical protein